MKLKIILLLTAIQYLMVNSTTRYHVLTFHYIKQIYPNYKTVNKINLTSLKIKEFETAVKYGKTNTLLILNCNCLNRLTSNLI